MADDNTLKGHIDGFVDVFGADLTVRMLTPVVDGLERGVSARDIMDYFCEIALRLADDSPEIVAMVEAVRGDGA